MAGIHSKINSLPICCRVLAAKASVDFGYGGLFGAMEEPLLFAFPAPEHPHMPQALDRHPFIRLKHADMRANTPDTSGHCERPHIR